MVVANEAPPAVEAPAAVPRPTEPVSNDQWQTIVDYWKPYLEKLRTGAEQPIQLRGASVVRRRVGRCLSLRGLGLPSDFRPSPRSG